MNDDNADVLIIGAGAAGLAAAVDLTAADLKVLVIEARDRIGGRISTRLDSDGLPIELGAEFIHGKAPEIWSILEAAGLVTCDVAENHVQLRDGQLVVRSDDLWKDVDEIMSSMEKEPEDCSFLDFINRNFGDERWEAARKAALSYVQGFNAASADQIGIHSLIQQTQAMEDTGGDVAFRVVGGYGRLIGWFKDQLPPQNCTILTDTVVSRICWSKGRVEALAQDKRLAARCAIVTVPLGVLQAAAGSPGSIEFEPELHDKRKAMQGLVMGQATRLVMRFKDRFWEKLEVQAGSERQSLEGMGFIHTRDLPVPTWWTQLYLRAPILVGWAGGPKCHQFEGKPKDYLYREALSSLSSIFGLPVPELESRLLSWHCHNWQEDPFARGAYSYVRPGGLEAQKELAQSVEGTLFFAGEATTLAGHFGTVHGAIGTGKRASREVISALKAKLAAN